MNSLREQAGIRWRRYRSRQSLFHNPLGIIPLVNLALLIMLFMLLHASFVRQPASAVQLPNATFLNGAPYGLMVVVVTQEGLVFFNDERMALDDLAPAFNRAVRDRKATAITIEADILVPYGVILRVMNMATAAGLQQVNLATRPSFGEEAMP
ncbi:MAG: biopolymer transporter ExbD [Kiritimatiellae bacterium]|nr:biopolymer transporter ExbD [Kiritimatiellia bacterium]